MEKESKTMNWLSGMDKYFALCENGIEPFGGRYVRTHLAQELLDNFESLEGTEVSIAGRVMSLRVHGKAAFCDLQDRSARIQIYASVNNLGEDVYEIFKALDIGDIIGISGLVFHRAEKFPWKRRNHIFV